MVSEDVVSCADSRAPGGLTEYRVGRSLWPLQYCDRSTMRTTVQITDERMKTTCDWEYKSVGYILKVMKEGTPFGEAVHVLAAK
jgi:hypothetical protein